MINNLIKVININKNLCTNCIDVSLVAELTVKEKPKVAWYSFR